VAMRDWFNILAPMIGLGCSPDFCTWSCLRMLVCHTQEKLGTNYCRTGESWREFGLHITCQAVNIVIPKQQRYSTGTSRTVEIHDTAIMQGFQWKILKHEGHIKRSNPNMMSSPPAYRNFHMQLFILRAAKARNHYRIHIGEVRD
jgi:hypothetical protein